MVWTEIPLNGRSDLYVFSRGHMTAAIHSNVIREQLVSPYAGVIVDAFILMQDNACAHTVRMSLTFLYDEVITVMNWQTSYADLNPIEHTWEMLSRRIRQRPHHPGNVENRIDAQVPELLAIPQKGTRSMPCHCQECVNDKGGHTIVWGTNVLTIIYKLTAQRLGKFCYAHKSNPYLGVGMHVCT